MSIDSIDNNAHNNSNRYSINNNDKSEVRVTAMTTYNSSINNNSNNDLNNNLALAIRTNETLNDINNNNNDFTYNNNNNLTPIRPTARFQMFSPKNERPLTPSQRQVSSLLGPVRDHHQGKLCLVLDLDETLVHSSFQPIQKSDFIIPVTIEGCMHNVFVLKRPGVDEFLIRAAKHFEIVVYTASLSKYADPLLDKLDKYKLITTRLFREHCVYHQGHYVKDLSLLNRDLNKTIIVDNSPMSYIFHPCK